MNAMPDRAAFAYRRAGPPTPLLAFLAGEHAGAIANLWPAPHEAFFALPAARRHAAAILIAQGARRNLPRWLACQRDSAIARELFGEDAPGLMNVFGKSGEILWPGAAYTQLLELFAEPNANRALRHMEALTARNIQPLAFLPPELRKAKILVALPGEQAAADLALAYTLIGHMNGEKGQRSMVEAWSRAKDREALFQNAAHNLGPRVFEPPVPVPDLPAPFEPVRTMEQLCRIALEFRNCLRDFAGDVANGRMAVLVWRGQPNAAVALTWDAAGWRLAEAEAANNQPLDEAPLREIVDVVHCAGVRTGPSLRALNDRLRRHVYELVDPFGPQLADEIQLGDLWP